MGRLGVALEDRPAFYEPEDEDEYYFSSGQRQFAIMTQNVDALHEQAGSNAVVHLHGRGNVVRCMNCGKRQGRNEFTEDLKSMNQQWLEDAERGYDQSFDLRPDGDAIVRYVNYDHVHVPDCRHCKDGFFKTDVVFFGDTVPKHRVLMCQEAVDVADGILVVGSSLAVHSAYRHIRAARKQGTPVAILNVGETRAEAEGLDGLLKIEAPAGKTLEICAKKFSEDLNVPSAATM
jgi:NAD-dependent deacetylase sirtuin 4